MNEQFINAIEELEKEKHISKDMVIDAIESALVTAYKKNYSTSQNIRVEINRETGDIVVYMVRKVLPDEEVTDEYGELTLDEAHEIDPNLKIGDELESRITPKDFGRIAAQTAKQVVVQRIREAERGIIYDTFSRKQGEIISGIVQRVSNQTVFINVGSDENPIEGIMVSSEQVRGEEYRLNEHINVYIMDVKKTTKGPQIYLSRSHPGLVKRLFEREVPEIHDGIVEIRSTAREAGSRTKMAVYTADPDVDAVGSCVGPRGMRVQAVVNELYGEKIDIINWSDDPSELVMSALSPAKAEKVYIDEAEKSATVVVPDYQLSLAIGKEGQNVRLAAKLCNWKIDIKSHTQFEENGGEAAILEAIALAAEKRLAESLKDQAEDLVAEDPDEDIFEAETAAAEAAVPSDEVPGADAPAGENVPESAAHESAEESETDGEDLSVEEESVKAVEDPEEEPEVSLEEEAEEEPVLSEGDIPDED